MNYKLFFCNALIFSITLFAAEHPKPTEEVNLTELLIKEQYGKPLIYNPCRGAYSSAVKKTGCPFCNHLEENTDEKFLILRRFDHFAVMLNEFPFIPGQLLIFPHKKKNEQTFECIKNLDELSLEARGELSELIPACFSLLKKDIKADYVTGGINVEKIAGASVPNHFHVHFMPLATNNQWKDDLLSSYIKDFNKSNFEAADLTILFQKLKPFFNNLTLPKHTLFIPKTIANTTPETTHDRYKHCGLCSILNECNDEKWHVLHRFKHFAVMFKPFPDTEGHLLVMPLDHANFSNSLSVQVRSELIELIGRLIEVMKKELSADGVNIGFNFEKNPNTQNKSYLMHQNIELLPRYANEMVGYTQKLTGIVLLSKNLQNLYEKLKPVIQTITIPEHQLVQDTSTQKEH